MKIKNRMDARRRRHFRVRKKVQGTADCPRMSIMVSRRNMYIQFIDDEKAVTVASVSASGSGVGHNIDGARKLGGVAGAAASEAGIKSVTVDRGGFKYHGRVKAVVDGAVESGLGVGTRSGGGSGKEEEPGAAEQDE